MQRACVLAVFTALAIFGQGTPTKPKASDYPVQGRVGEIDIGAEFMFRLISHGRDSFVTDNFLVVELALFPSVYREHNVKTTDFVLRINGKKEALLAATPQIVSMSLKYPVWEDYGLRTSAQVGNGRIETGPQPGGRFPGDPRGQRLPRPEVSTTPEGKPESDRQTPEQVVHASALPEGPRKTSVSGLIFFPYKGKTDKLKSVELTYEPVSGQSVVLRLR